MAKRSIKGYAITSDCGHHIARYDEPDVHPLLIFATKTEAANALWKTDEKIKTVKITIEKD